jgi:hypothetical protein
LAHPIHEEHQREWYIQGFFPMTRILLTQQWMAMLTNTLEQSMKIEAMVGYPRRLRMKRPLVYVNLVQLQGQISTLTENIQELTIPKLGRPQVWCTGCYTKGHLANEFPRIRGMGSPQNPMVPPPEPERGFAQVSMNLPFHNPTMYHAFLGGQAAPTVEYCEIC